MMATQWEYKLENSPETNQLAQFLTNESEQGWDLVTVVTEHLVLRREVTNPTWSS
jgi:hypothetical protein